MSTTKITGTGLGLPTADGAALGGASNEFSDLYLADGSVIYFGADQEVKVTHVADTGLTLKHTATADDKPISLTLQTGETDMAANDVMGKISFQAPDEGTGTDAILVAAAIQARAEGDFSSSSNATSLDFMTGSSEAAAKKWSITSAGSFLNAGTNTIDMNAGELILDADADTSITASTDDQIDIRIAGADDFTFTANTFTAASGSGVVIPDSGLTLGSTAVTSTAAELNTLDALSRGSVLYGNASAVTTVLTKGTANQVLTSDGTDLSWADASGGGSDPASADGDTLGTASAEWSDLYLADGGVIYLGNDQDVTLTHNADTGVTCNTALNAANLQLAGYQLNGFTIGFYNADGTIRHAIGRSGSSLGVSGYDYSVTGAVNAWTVTPTGADGSTAMAGGMKIGSAATNAIWLDTASLNAALWMCIGSMGYNNHGENITVTGAISNLDINGTTQWRPRITFEDNGGAVALNTTNIATGEFFTVDVWFWAPPV